MTDQRIAGGVECFVHPRVLMRIVFIVLVGVLVLYAHPRTAREWTLVWAVLVFLAWALLGFGWLRAG